MTDVYGPMIKEALTRSGAGGMTSREIIESIKPASEWGLRAALNRLFRKGQIAKIFEVQKDARGRPVDRPDRVVVNQFGEERRVRVGPMREYRFFLRDYAPVGRPNLSIEDLPPAEAGARTIKIYTPEERAALAAEKGLPNEVTQRGKR
jgi:hypothetical protein